MSYSPTLGRFLETDPIGYDDGMNRYQYVGSNPSARADPFGLEGAATQPAPARPTNPAGTNVIAIPDNIDLLVIAHKEWPDATYRKRLDEYKAAHPKCEVVQAGTPDGVIAAIKDYAEKRAKANNGKLDQKLNVAIASHGATVNGQTYLPDLDPGFTRDQDIRQAIAKHPIPQLKGLVASLTIAGCAVAKEEEDRRLLNLIQEATGMEISAFKDDVSGVPIKGKLIYTPDNREKWKKVGDLVYTTPDKKLEQKK